MPSKSVRPQRASHSTCKRPREEPRSLQRAGAAGQCWPGMVALKALCHAPYPDASLFWLSPCTGADETVAAGSLQGEEGPPVLPAFPLCCSPLVSSMGRMSSSFFSCWRAWTWPLAAALVLDPLAQPHLLPTAMKVGQPAAGPLSPLLPIADFQSYSPCHSPAASLRPPPSSAKGQSQPMPWTCLCHPPYADGQASLPPI